MPAIAGVGPFSPFGSYEYWSARNNVYAHSVAEYLPNLEVLNAHVLPGAFSAIAREGGMQHLRNLNTLGSSRIVCEDLGHIPKAFPAMNQLRISSPIVGHREYGSSIVSPEGLRRCVLHADFSESALEQLGAVAAKVTELSISTRSLL